MAWMPPSDGIAMYQRISQIEGIGPIAATALVAAVGDKSCCRNGRQFAAWLGLVSKQHSSGGKARLFGISKRGDRYFRTMLIHGARCWAARPEKPAREASGSTGCGKDVIRMSSRSPWQTRTHGSFGRFCQTNRNTVGDIWSEPSDERPSQGELKGILQHLPWHIRCR